MQCEAKFGVRSFIHSKVMEGSQILNLGHVTLTTPTLGPIYCALASTCHVMVNVCTKYEVSIFGHSKYIKGVPKFRKWSRDLSNAPLGSNFHILTKGFIKCISPQNLECIALSIRKLWRGSHISNLGHVTLFNMQLLRSYH